MPYCAGSVLRGCIAVLYFGVLRLRNAEGYCMDCIAFTYFTKTGAI